MRGLGALVQSLVLAMVHTWQDLPFGGSLAGQFVGDDHAGHVLEPFEPLAEEFSGGRLGAPALHQDSQDSARLVDGPPQLACLAIDLETDFV